MARYAPISRRDFTEIQLGGIFKRQPVKMHNWPIVKMKKERTKKK